MKRQSLKSGFTLVELLVVIAIIATLAGMSAVAYGGFVKSAKKQQSQAIVDAIESAIEQYHAEYGSFPPPVRNAVGAGYTFTSGATAATDDMAVLLGELTGEVTTINYKGKQFLSLDDAESDSNGMTRDTTNDNPLAVFDPAGVPYTLLFNSSYDQTGTAIPTGYLNAGNRIQAKVLIYNEGIDETVGTKDDVVSWN